MARAFSGWMRKYKSYYVRTFQCRMPFSTLLRRPPRRLRSGRYTPLHFVYRPSHDVYAFCLLHSSFCSFTFLIARAMTYMSFTIKDSAFTASLLHSSFCSFTFHRAGTSRGAIRSPRALSEISSWTRNLSIIDRISVRGLRVKAS